MLRISREWQLQDAKARFSAVVGGANTDGPQRITRHGKPAAIVLSEADFQRLNRGERSSLSDFLATLPFGDLEIVRDATDTGREIEL
jgi:antitoxin Phd